jgi:hypothetical protein
MTFLTWWSQFHYKYQSLRISLEFRHILNQTQDIRKTYITYIKDNKHTQCRLIYNSSSMKIFFKESQCKISLVFGYQALSCKVWPLAQALEFFPRMSCLEWFCSPPHNNTDIYLTDKGGRISWVHIWKRSSLVYYKRLSFLHLCPHVV